MFSNKIVIFFQEMLFVFVMLLQFPLDFLVVVYVGFRVVMEDIDGYRGERQSLAGCLG